MINKERMFEISHDVSHFIVPDARTTHIRLWYLGSVLMAGVSLHETGQVTKYNQQLSNPNLDVIAREDLEMARAVHIGESFVAQGLGIIGGIMLTGLSRRK